MSKINYPVLGFAPGNYFSVCAICKEEFVGDKLSTQCEPCAINLMKELFHKNNKELIDLRETMVSAAKTVKTFENLLKYPATSEDVLKTSYDWYKTEDTIILDPDGWDRKNYQYSFYEEKITYSEFKKRMMMSTCKLKNSTGGSLKFDVLDNIKHKAELKGNLLKICLYGNNIDRKMIDNIVEKIDHRPLAIHTESEWVNIEK